MRALAWGGKSLFGVDRVANLADVAADRALACRAARRAAYDPATAWTHGRGRRHPARPRRLARDPGQQAGADFPFDGGTVEITGRCKDCSPLGLGPAVHEADRQRGRRARPRQGRRPRDRQLREPGPERVPVPRQGDGVLAPTRSTSRGSRTPGIDWVSLANNHIGDAGRNGILQTMENLDEYGIAPRGRRARTRRRPTRRRCSRSATSRSGSSATTRSRRLLPGAGHRRAAPG